jgi:hypothetical protein
MGVIAVAVAVAVAVVVDVGGGGGGDGGGVDHGLAVECLLLYPDRLRDYGWKVSWCCGGVDSPDWRYLKMRIAFGPLFSRTKRLKKRKVLISPNSS